MVTKTNASFNLSKPVKYKLAGILDKTQRNIYKKMMIDAEASYAAGKNRKFSDPATSQRPSRETPKE
jgi:hypothetical protein